MMEKVDTKDLIKAAETAAHRAYAPYSRFSVGAALLGKDGKIYSGCNVENASYGLTICAERVAIGTAIAHGCREFSQIVIYTDTPSPTPPCGACRQVLNEFSPNLEVVLVNPQGIVGRLTLGELLPLAFGPGNLHK